jgi:hypothetical protein
VSDWKRRERQAFGRNITPFLGYSEDVLARFIADSRLVVEYPGDRTYRNSRLMGNLTDSSQSALAFADVY